MSLLHRFAVVAVLAVAAHSTAHADAEAAKAHYKAGLGKFALGRYAEAAVEYEAAFDQEPDPALLYNAAQAHRLAGNKPRALLLYQNYLRIFPNRPNKAEVQRHIAALKAAIEADASSRTAPPVEPMLPTATTPAPAPTAPVVSEPSAKSPELGPAAVTTTTAAAALTATAPPPPKRRTPRWVWGAVGGGAALVVGVALGVGLGVGLSSPVDPTPSIGKGTLK
jgi:tetratricopeptide (TPR) repeat protein